MPKYVEKDWKTEWQNNTKIDEAMFPIDQYKIYQGERNYTKERFLELKKGVGSGQSFLLINLLFMYLGAKVQAKKQFIPGVFFFQK